MQIGAPLPRQIAPIGHPNPSCQQPLASVPLSAPANIDHPSFLVGSTFSSLTTFLAAARSTFLQHGCRLELGSPTLQTVLSPTNYPRVGTLQLHCSPRGLDDPKLCPCLIELEFHQMDATTPIDGLEGRIVKYVAEHAHHRRNEGVIQSEALLVPSKDQFRRLTAPNQVCSQSYMLTSQYSRSTELAC